MLEKINPLKLEKILLFWKNLSEKEKNTISSNTTLSSYKKGESIHSPLNECTGILAVEKGRLRVYILSEEGKEITLLHINRREVCILSASCLLKNITFDVYINAEENSDILLINPTIFSQILEKNIYVENYILKATVERFLDIIKAMENMLFLTFDKRLAIFLEAEINTGRSLTIHLTHEQIAKNIGSAREVVTRTLKEFSKKKYSIIN